jgi:hypothetical protein
MAIEKDFGAETTTDRDYANVRNFYKVELWTKDDQRVESGCCTPAIVSTRRAKCLPQQSSTGQAVATPSASAAVWLSSGRSGSEAHSRARRFLSP